jgi:hypothetical protein
MVFEAPAVATPVVAEPVVAEDDDDAPVEAEVVVEPEPAPHQPPPVPTPPVPTPSVPTPSVPTPSVPTASVPAGAGATTAVGTALVPFVDLGEDLPGRVPAGPWPERLVVAAVVLAATDALLLLGVLVTGLVANGKQGSAGARLGAAYVGGVGTAHTLLLVVAAGLLAWASQAGAAAAGRGAKVVLTLAVMFFVLSPFAAWGDVAYLHHAKQAIDGVVRAQVTTWMAVTMVPAGVASALAWWAGSRRV